MTQDAHLGSIVTRPELLGGLLGAQSRHAENFSNDLEADLYVRPSESDFEYPEIKYAIFQAMI